MNKLLLIGPSTNPIHLTNFYDLIKDYFDEILVVSSGEFELCQNIKMDFSLSNPLKLAKNIKKLRKIIIDFSPSIIQVHQANSFAFITSVANNGRYPQVLTTWGSDVLLLPKKNLFYKRLVAYSLKKSDYLTANANYMIEAIHKLVNKPVLLLNYGIDYQGIELPIKKEKIIYSNRLLNPIYRTDDIIIGFAEFVKKNPDWKLLIAGNGTEEEKLKKLADSVLPKDSFSFVGFVKSDINKQNYLKSYIWISNPISDGTAISLYESMGYGCISVTSDLPATKEVITNDKNGVIAIKGISEGLERAIKMILEEVQKINKEIIITTATKEVNKKKITDLYDEIIKNHD